ncbi:MAG TPA: hypothetical protein VGG39_19895 [Polyangiaceae bacterium]|jgi:hypothetical protein
MRPAAPGRPCLAVLLGLALCLSSAAARAQDPGQDEVTLKSGGSIRGTLVVVEPGKSVEIAVMGEAQPRLLPWSDVDQVLKGKYGPAPAPSAQPVPAPPPLQAPPPPPPPPPPPSVPPAPKLGGPGVVRVHIDSPSQVTLLDVHLVSHPVTESWVDGFGNTVTRDATATELHEDPLCSSPCDRVIRDSYLRIAGKGFPSSSGFDLGGRTGDLTLRVRPGSDAEYAGGIAAIVVGSLATVVGTIMIPLNEKDSTTTDANTGAKVHVPDPALRTAGIGLIAGGIVGIAGGIALVLFGRTTVTVSPQAGLAPAAAKPRYWMGEF